MITCEQLGRARAARLPQGIARSQRSPSQSGAAAHLIYQLPTTLLEIQRLLKPLEDSEPEHVVD
jgi:hypothetical protein